MPNHQHIFFVFDVPSRSGRDRQLHCRYPLGRQLHVVVRLQRICRKGFVIRSKELSCLVSVFVVLLVFLSADKHS